MYDKLFDLLFTGSFYTHSIGDASKKTTLDKFESIIKLKGIYSKDELQKRGIIVDGKVQGNIRMTKSNKVSLFDPLYVNFAQFIKQNNRYRLSLGDITFLVDNKSIDKRGQRHDFDFSEVVVDDYVTIGEICGILMPYNEELINNVVRILEDNNIDLPIFDILGNEVLLQKHDR